MGSFGPNNAATFASDATVGTIAITNPSNAQISDNSYATAVLLLGQVTNYLKATNFGFTIPLDATITGILIEVEKSSTLSSALTDNIVSLVKAGSITGNNNAAVGNWATSDAYTSYGSSTDLWGLGLLPSDVNNSNFGMVISATDLLAATAQIDHVRMTVYYTGSNRPGNIGGHVSVGDGMSRNEITS